mmetsp:Transcript_5499/g.16283  ORF Transcript_5499/g.16283 Transcript_5499/m.16283 type:complete len:207 (-) Transcript_5499:2244-2864(-)
MLAKQTGRGNCRFGRHADGRGPWRNAVFRWRSQAANITTAVSNDFRRKCQCRRSLAQVSQPKAEQGTAQALVRLRRPGQRRGGQLRWRQCIVRIPQTVQGKALVALQQDEVLPGRASGQIDGGGGLQKGAKGSASLEEHLRGAARGRAILPGSQFSKGQVRKGLPQGRAQQQLRLREFVQEAIQDHDRRLRVDRRQDEHDGHQAGR